MIITNKGGGSQLLKLYYKHNLTDDNRLQDTFLGALSTLQTAC
jgi:hypothetical protein